MPGAANPTGTLFDLARRGMTRAADSSFLAIDASGFVALAAGTLRQVCWA